MSNLGPIGIVDIFAGPGGLSEGFASVGKRGSRRFRIALSIEKDSAAVRTLRLRSAVHEMDQQQYEQYIELLNNNATVDERLIETNFPDLWARTEGIVQHHELSDVNKTLTEAMLDRVKERQFSAIGLIGGPPCQVYSLAGRSRNAGNHNYKGDNDHRHTLYKQYIHVLDYLKPDFFVMENVKGMLSSRHQSQHIFPLVKKDLEDAGYRLYALGARGRQPGLLPHELRPMDHKDFIVHMEDFGVPQKRHRIIILGLRKDVAENLSLTDEINHHLEPSAPATVHQAISDLPKLRSGLSKGEDTTERWQTLIDSLATRLSQLNLDEDILHELQKLNETIENLALPKDRTSHEYTRSSESTGAMRFVRNRQLSRLHHHETRSHIESDLERYIFASAFAQAKDYSPKASDFPTELAPDHKNWNSGNFNDRFRVQLWGSASSTITSHISKDGHFYIHPDPTQARSLTVREAARLQTFPDDYIFLGNRTEQYHQVGNAVPAYLAWHIASLIRELVLPHHILNLEVENVP